MATLVNEELKLLERTAQDFAAKELVEDRVERDNYPFAPLFETVLSKAHDLGFLAVTLPEEMGGAGMSVTAMVLLLKDLCQADASLGAVIFTNALALEIMRNAKAEEQLARVIQQDAGFRDALLAFPSFNDPGSIKNMADAVSVDGGFALTGSVDYVVLGNVAVHALLPARLAGSDGYSFFLVDLNGPGVTASEPVLSLGMRACPAVDLALQGAPAALVGVAGSGDAYFAPAAALMQLASAGMAAGVLRGSFTEALAYAEQRRQGGREIVNWSEVRMLLASMAIKLKTSDLCLEQACREFEEESEGWSLSAAAASLYIQEIAITTTTDGIQLLGGNGYMKEYHQEKRFRDAQQIQALLGLAPVRRIKFIGRIIDGESI